MSFYDYTPMRRVAETPSEFVRRYQAMDQGHSQSQSASKVSSLASGYESARNGYLWRYGIPFCHPSLQFPFLFFYLEDPQSEHSPICHISPFLCENRYTSHMTKESFPAFLTNVCAIPYVPGEKADQFYSALEALLRHGPKNRLRLIQEEIGMISPAFSGWKQLQSAIAVDQEQNLFVLAEAAGELAGGVKPPSGYLSVLQLPAEHYLPAPLMRQYLQACQAEDIPAIPQREAQARTLLYRASHTEGAPVLTAVYRAESNCFALRTQAFPPFHIKVMPLERAAGQELPGGLEPVFRMLCGAGTQLLDSLAQALARAMDPVLGGGLTIFYTKQHKQLLLRVLEQLFGGACIAPEAFTRHPKSGGELPSLNQLTKPENLIQLFLGQVNGAGVVLVSDLVPSEASLQTVRRLTGGKALSLATPSCPPQHFVNKLSFLCVTDRPDRAQLLEKRLKAQVIDLSCAELPAQDAVTLSPQDVHWLRTAFMLYGLKLYTLDSQKEERPARVSASLSLREEIRSFLLADCQRGAGLHCDTGRLYQGFLEAHLKRHPGTEAPVSKICFNKAVRDLIAQESGCSITYKKLRPAPQEPPRWYYIGVDLPRNDGDLSSVSTAAEEPEETLTQCLERIHRSRLPL